MPRNGRFGGGHGFGHRHGHFGHGGHFGHHRHGHFGHSGLRLGLGTGHRSNRHHIGGRSTISPMDMMILNAPIGNTMLNVPVGNYYGILGTPGGARATVASPAESVDPPPYSAVSSSVLYPPEPRYSQNEQTQYGTKNPSPVGFEGVHPQINPAPSLSNVTVDYQVSADGQRLEPTAPAYEGKGEPYIDHFPQPGRTTPDSLADIHHAPPLKPRKIPRDRGVEEPECCVIS